MVVKKPISLTTIAFAKDCLISDSDGYIISKELYQKFKDYAFKTNGIASAHQRFTRQLKEIFVLEYSGKRINGKLEHIVCGIKFK